MATKLEHIQSIEKLDITDQYVYDFEVPEHQSFLANDIFVHNTDSIFIQVDDDQVMAELIIDLNKDFVNYVENEIGVHNNIIFLEYEKKFKNLIMQDKKRYTGLVTESDGNKTDKIFSRGTENIKKNTITFARTAITELITSIVREEMTDVKDAHTFIKELKQRVETEDIDPEDLLILTRVSKSPHKYKSKAVHVRLAERLIAEGKLQPIDEGSSWGTRLRYITIKDPVTEKNEGLLLEEFTTGCWDRDYYWDVQIFAPLQRALQTVWPDEDWKVYTVAEIEKRRKAEAREEVKALREIEKVEKELEKEKKKAEKAEKMRIAAEEKETKRLEKAANMKASTEERARKAQEKKDYVSST